MLCTSLASSLLFTAGTAEARFGKSSNSSSNDKVHDASPVGSSNSSSGGSSSGGSSSGGSSSSSNAVDTVGTILDILHIAADVAEIASHVEATTTYETTYQQPPPVQAQVQLAPGEQPMYPYGREPVVQQQVQQTQERNRNLLMFRVNAEGLAVASGGSAVGLNAGIEGQHWGVALAGTGMRLPTDDGTPGVDKIDLFNLHLTLAVYTDDQTRLRLEGGVASAKAPSATFTGPSFAVSFERCLNGVLDLETRAQVVPAPHLQIDAQAGLALHLSAINLRAGWRVMTLDDRGQVDGVVHRDYFSGPYAGVGLYF
ncbi:hypothetical protein Q664_44915 [Archangium violaceum Cb vi76]|uniref:Uncharacterized protein n=1 Tax=Archangium violaceum Cb vi76 TaxID=1406225 RepID=A0A084SHJ0_9BACT|nr:hypothetical protein Q664_44915 [Archangium violaceum Cb vi76]